VRSYAKHAKKKPFLFGLLFASFLWAMLVFALNFETRLPQVSNWEERFEVYETAITEDRRLYDRIANRTILSTPGNPKTNVIEVKEIGTGKWQVVLEVIY
jgi:hypothetical protein